MLIEGDEIKHFLQLDQKENDQRWRTNKHFNEHAGFLCQSKNFTEKKCIQIENSKQKRNQKHCAP